MKGAAPALSLAEGLALSLVVGLALNPAEGLGALAPLELKSLTARIVYVKGKVEWKGAGSSAWVPASSRRNLAAGDRVRTKARSLAEIALENGSVLRLAPSSEVFLKEPGVGEKVVTSVKVQVGHFWCNVSRLTRRGSKFEVDTQSATIGVRGTIFDVGAEAEAGTQVQVYEGKVEVWNPFQQADPNASNETMEAPSEVAPNFSEISREQWTVSLELNQELTVKPSGEHETKSIDPKAEAEKDDWVHFNQERDRILAQSREAYLRGQSEISQAESKELIPAVAPAPAAEAPKTDAPKP